MLAAARGRAEMRAHARVEGGFEGRSLRAVIRSATYRTFEAAQCISSPWRSPCKRQGGCSGPTRRVGSLHCRAARGGIRKKVLKKEAAQERPQVQGGNAQMGMR